VIVAALALLALTAVAAGLRLVLRRVLVDPTVLVAGVTVALLAVAALMAADAGTAHGWRRASALVLGVVVAVTGGSDVVRATFRLMRGELGGRRRPGVTTQSASSTGSNEPATGAVGVAETPAESVLRGGAWIGYLERAAISATLLAGWPEGMALVLAVKGVGRYPELRDARSNEAHASEAFIIGTLVSVLWAVAAAGVASLLLG
jgi:hypothetical protein